MGELLDGMADEGWVEVELVGEDGDFWEDGEFGEEFVGGFVRLRWLLGGFSGVTSFLAGVFGFE